MSEYYKKLYYDSIENNQIMSKELNRLNSNNEYLIEKRKYDLCFIQHLKKDKKDLQQRIDKAIEYIKDNYDDYEESILGIEFKNGLLEILGDKE